MEPNNSKIIAAAPPPAITTSAQQLPGTQPPSPPLSEPAPPKAEAELSTSLNAPVVTTPPFSPSSQTPMVQKEQEEFEGNLDVNDDLPTDKDLQRVGDLLVLDDKGQSRPFKELYNAPHVAPRQLIIFIRHFFCGNCQEYLRTLSSSITPDALLALPTPTFITVIGCGKPDLIPMYQEATSCPFPIYADPTRKLYDILGMTRTLNLGPKPEYIHTNLLINSVQSVFQSLGTGKNALKGGDFKQVGGEFLFESGECTWAHRMKNTRDHAEVSSLRTLIGLDDTRPPMRKRWSHGIKETDKQRRSLSWGRLRSKSKGTREPERDTTRKSTPEMVEEETPNKTARSSAV